MDPVGARVLPLAPGAQEFAGAVEHHHRMLAAPESIDVVVFVDADRGDLLERPAVGQLRPVLDDAVPVFARPDLDRHKRPPVALSIAKRAYRTGQSETIASPDEGPTRIRERRVQTAREDRQMRGGYLRVEVVL